MARHKIRNNDGSKTLNVSNGVYSIKMCIAAENINVGEREYIQYSHLLWVTLHIDYID